jgi:cytochrome c peroxidase
MLIRLRHGALISAALLVLGASALQAARAGWTWPALPAGIAPPPVPADNGMSALKVALGRRLFYDRALSRDGSLACADCHRQERGFTDGLRTHVGVSGEMGVRNVPGLANVGWRRALTWTDAGLVTLEAQALAPMTGTAPVEMGMKGQEREVARRLNGDPCYRRLFVLAFPRARNDVGFARITEALAAFQRTMISFDSPFDRYIRGERRALSPQAAAGFRQFNAAGCAACHSGADFTDSKTHYVGTAAPSAADGARYGGLPLPPDFVPPPDSFRTPSLRNVSVTGPWLHDGKADSIESAIRRHAATALVGVDMASLLAFLDSLTDRSFLTAAHLARPSATCPI